VLSVYKPTTVYYTQCSHDVASTGIRELTKILQHASLRSKLAHQQGMRPISLVGGDALSFFQCF